MSFPASPTFNPAVSQVPILDPSSGNPASFKDPKSVASLGKKLQGMKDQSNADQLYDPKIETFCNPQLQTKYIGISILAFLGLACIYCSLDR
jgi:hypothetical protein